MNVGSLFSGIGGLDLGLERAGMTVVWQSEIDPYASRVLAKHWPTVPNLGDITTIDWTTVEPVDVICGGYPCQPFSLAGVRRGDTDPRHLWPHFHRAVRHLRPRYALLENVPGHLSMGFGRVLGDLAEIGYDVEWCCIPAAAVGAPHLRYRIFAVAHRDGGGQQVLTQRHGEPVEDPADRHPRRDDADGLRDDVADTTGRVGTDVTRRAETDGSQPLGRPRTGASGRSGRRGAAPRAGLVGRPAPEMAQDVADPEIDTIGSGLRQVDPRTQTGRLDVTEPADGGWWTVEPDVGRVAHGIPNRVDRLRCLGNAVVPQVAEWIGRRLMDAHNRRTVNGVLIGLTDEPGGDVDQRVGDVDGEVSSGTVAVNGHGQGVSHSAHPDAREPKVKTA